ncbi:unnamed protein product [Microthlaspi erraticum]|uniref:Uncharacterized protein n=1 Tax=Microthlaspi erraticum TaxID=1685480 RepID=A0A6D2LIB3_9BRAS|nr:unnamed protein product [Microthlaspi erraticum]
MKHLVVFLLVTVALQFGLNDACTDNDVVFRNRLGKDIILKVSCESNKKHRSIGSVNFMGIPHRITFGEEVGGKTTWHCLLRYGQFTSHFRAYKGGSLIPRCGELRVYIAKPDGIYLEKNADREKLDQRWMKM